MPPCWSRYELGVGFEISKLYTFPLSSFSVPCACGSVKSSQLLLQYHVCFPDAIFPHLLNSLCSNKLFFFHKLPFSWCLFTSIETDYSRYYAVRLYSVSTSLLLYFQSCAAIKYQKPSIFTQKIASIYK